MISKMKGVHLGSYWNGVNDIVALMSRYLRDRCDLTVVDPDLYGPGKNVWVEEDFSLHPNEPIRWLRHEAICELTKRHHPNFLVVNAGGMALRPETCAWLREHQVVSVGISLSDPDVYPRHGKAYAHLFDLFYSNSAYAVSNLYAPEIRCRLLPFAASTHLHRPLPDVPKIYDVVVVGHARPERQALVRTLRKHVSVGVFGHGWGDGTGPVSGEAHVQAINSGRMYLSFAPTMAGFVNVKVGLFEAMACRQFVITQRFQELERYFMYGLEVMGYQTPSELVEIIHFYKSHDSLREWVAENGYRRLIKEHTWAHRWESVLKDIQTVVLKRRGAVQREIRLEVNHGES